MGYDSYHGSLDRAEAEGEISTNERDAARYRALRNRGVAPAGTLHLQGGNVMCSTGLDGWTDALIAGNPIAPAEATEYPKRRGFLDTLPVDRDDALVILSGFTGLAFGYPGNDIASLHPDDEKVLRGNVERAVALLRNTPLAVFGANRSAMQPWTLDCSVMMQSVMMSAIRGMDGLKKLHPAKMLIRFYRRSILISAFDMAPINDAYGKGGGDFTGPSLTVENFDTTDTDIEGDVVLGRDLKWLPVTRWIEAMQRVADDFIRARDEMPLHYFTHTMHAFHIVAVKHPVPEIRAFWRTVYERMVHALHLTPEDDAAMMLRLSDDPAAWQARSDEAGSCQT